MQCTNSNIIYKEMNDPQTEQENVQPNTRCALDKAQNTSCATVHETGMISWYLSIYISLFRGSKKTCRCVSC